MIFCRSVFKQLIFPSPIWSWKYFLSQSLSHCMNGLCLMQWVLVHKCQIVSNQPWHVHTTDLQCQSKKDHCVCEDERVSRESKIL